MQFPASVTTLANCDTDGHAPSPQYAWLFHRMYHNHRPQYVYCYGYCNHSSIMLVYSWFITCFTTFSVIQTSVLISWVILMHLWAVIIILLYPVSITIRKPPALPPGMLSVLSNELNYAINLWDCVIPCLDMHGIIHGYTMSCSKIHAWYINDNRNVSWYSLQVVLLLY